MIISIIIVYLKVKCPGEGGTRAFDVDILAYPSQNARIPDGFFMEEVFNFVNYPFG
jgi:hypothetical protein